jgi:4-hydroxybenzoate polyprenyltransferase
MSYSIFKNLYSLLRIYQWVKNGIIFFPLFFSEKLFIEQTALHTTITFLVFCFVSSMAYIINDLADIKKDQLHPVKRKRAIASGQFSKNAAIIIAFVLLITALLISILFLNSNEIIIISTYLLLNILYSFLLKNYSLFDIFMIAVFFELRLMAGGYAAGVILSPWLVLLTFFLALFLAAAKRRDDIMLNFTDKTLVRKSLSNYNEYFLNALIILLSAIIIVTYLLYTISPEVTARFGHQYYLTVFFPVLGVIRYLQVIFVFKTSGDPVKALYTDRMMQLFIGGWLALLFYFIYGTHV